MKNTTAAITRGALIASIYVLLSLILQPIQFGIIQFRPSEALVMLPLIMPEGIFGVTVGCALANLSSPFGLIDILLGTFATLSSAVLTWYLRKKPLLAGLPPVIINALVVPLVFALSGVEESYLISALYIAVSEAVVIYLIGLPLTKLVRRLTK